MLRRCVNILFFFPSPIHLYISQNNFRHFAPRPNPALIFYLLSLTYTKFASQTSAAVDVGSTGPRCVLTCHATAAVEQSPVLCLAFISGRENEKESKAAP